MTNPPAMWTISLIIMVQHSDNNTTALTASASLGSDHVRFRPGKVGAKSILAPIKSTDWDNNIDTLGFTINSHMPRISYPRAKHEPIKTLLCEGWPKSRRQAK